MSVIPSGVKKETQAKKVKKGPFGGGYSFTLRFLLSFFFLFLEGMLLNISSFSVFMKPYLIKAAVRNTGGEKVSGQVK